MIDSANVSRKATDDMKEKWRLECEELVERSWLPWIGRKVRKASAGGLAQVEFSCWPWFMTAEKAMVLRDVLGARLKALGYRVCWGFTTMSVVWEQA